MTGLVRELPDGIAQRKTNSCCRLRSARNILVSVSRIRLVAFDLGGVLADVDVGAIAVSLGRGWAEVEPAFFPAGLHDRLMNGAISPEIYFDTVARALGAEIAAVERAWSEVVRIRDFVPALLESLPVPYMIWSNTDPVHFGSQRTHLEPLPRALALSYELRASKPERAFYEAALALAGFTPREILFLDDRPENIAGALALDITAIRVENELQIRTALLEHGLVR